MFPKHLKGNLAILEEKILKSLANTFVRVI